MTLWVALTSAILPVLVTFIAISNDDPDLFYSRFVDGRNVIYPDILAICQFFLVIFAQCFVVVALLTAVICAAAGKRKF